MSPSPIYRLSHSCPNCGNIDAEQAEYDIDGGGTALIYRGYAWTCKAQVTPEVSVWLKEQDDPDLAAEDCLSYDERTGKLECGQPFEANPPF